MTTTGEATERSDPATPAHDEPRQRPPGHVRETVVLIMLSLTAVLTAWCGFESSKWSGEMSIAFNQASGSRVEAARQSGVANAARQADLTIWGVYVQARAEGDRPLASYVEKRFSPHFAVAHRAWLAAGEPTNAPFAMKEYVPPGTVEAAAADAHADSKFADALTDNQRGDNYSILTVLFALVLFFSAASTRFGRPRTQWTLIILALSFLLVAAAVLATFPVDL